MITQDDILYIPYLNETEYTGSHQGMRYRMEKLETKTEVTEGEETKTVVNKTLVVTIWPEPYNYFQTPDEKKQVKEFSFDEDGIVDSIAWMNDRLFYDKELWMDSEKQWEK